MPPRKRYYSARTGKNPLAERLDLPALKRMYLTINSQFWAKDYFQEAFGFYCPDAGHLRGTVHDVPGTIFVLLKKEDLWPIDERIADYKEDDLFDIIEFMYDHVSHPTNGTIHSFNDCGTHWARFDQEQGQKAYREALNPALLSYADGFEMDENGEILTLPPRGVGPILTATLPHNDKDNITGRVEAAIAKFRPAKASLQDRKEAVRELADVLEFLKKSTPGLLEGKDESDLFHIANKFGIRHHNLEQQTKYDKDIFYNWMFYHYLSTIHVCLRLIKRKKKSGAKA